MGGIYHLKFQSPSLELPNWRLYSKLGFLSLSHVDLCAKSFYVGGQRGAFLVTPQQPPWCVASAGDSGSHTHVWQSEMTSSPLCLLGPEAPRTENPRCHALGCQANWPCQRATAGAEGRRPCS